MTMKPEDIDFPVSYDWARHYDPSLPAIDDRTPRERRIGEGIAEAMRKIEAGMNGESPAEVSSPNYERETSILSARIDYLQVALAELRQRQKDRDSAKSPKKKGFDVPLSP